MVIIPSFANDPLYRERVRLGERDYFLAFDWNGRIGRWFLSLYAADGTLLFGGCKVVPNWLLFSRNPDPRLPPGSLVYVDTSSDPQAPNLTTLGVTGNLVYYDPGELT